MIYELVGYNTDSRYPNDIRYRKYTSSEREAKLFGKIPKIQFSDSWHGIVFVAREHRGAKQPIRTELSMYVYTELLKLQPPKRMRKTVLTEAQIIRSLKSLERNWNNEFWLFSASGHLNLMRNNPDGSRITHPNGSMSSDGIVCSFPNIPNDGGDW